MHLFYVCKMRRGRISTEKKLHYKAGFRENVFDYFVFYTMPA